MIELLSLRERPDRHGLAPLGESSGVFERELYREIPEHLE